MSLSEVESSREGAITSEKSVCVLPWSLGRVEWVSAMFGMFGTHNCIRQLLQGLPSIYQHA
jgi:hypothetical protein